jgi:hypothetical protein
MKERFAEEHANKKNGDISDDEDNGEEIIPVNDMVGVRQPSFAGQAAVGVDKQSSSKEGDP